MRDRERIQTKASSIPTSAFNQAETGLFRKRPFAVQAETETDTDAHPLPDLQTQLERGARFNESLSRMKVYGNRPVIQPKIAVGAPGDRYEQEADQVADRVMNMKAPTTNPQPVQRQEDPAEESLQMQPLAASITPLVQREAMPEEQEEQVQAKAIQRQEPSLEEEPEEQVQPKTIQSEQQKDRYEPKAGGVASSVHQSLNTESHCAFLKLNDQVVQRSDEASNTTEAANLAPDGPLAKLRDELDDTFVDEEVCLQYIGQLGSGERQLVRNDQTMMRQMAEALDGEEMLAAVERLDCELKWSIYWIDEAGEADCIGDAGYAQLIGSATSQEVAEMIGWAQVRQVVQNNYQANPLTFPPLVMDNAKTIHIISTVSSFSDWVLQQAGASLYLQYAAAHDPAAMLAALKTASKWEVLLSKLPRGNNLATADGSALFEIFKVATDASERRRLFEIRFDRRYPGEFDWMTNGQQRWSTEEQMGGAQTDAQIEADIAAGNGSTNVDEVIQTDAGGPLQQLRDNLDDFDVDEAACLQYLSQLSARERYLVRGNPTMMSQMASAFTGQEMSHALAFLQFPKIGEAVYWVKQAGVAGDIGRSGYETLINNTTSQQVAELIGWREMFNVVKENSQINPLAIPPLVSDDAMMAHVIATYDYFSNWVLENPGSQMYLRYFAAHTPAQTAVALKNAGKLNALLDALPAGISLAPDDQSALFILFQTYTDMPDKERLMEKRFNLDSVTQEDGAAPAWDAAGLERVWRLLEQLPPSHVADNEWLERLTRMTVNPASAPHHAVTGSHRVGMAYTTGNLGDVDTGQYTDAGDQMRGMNLFDGTLIHEVGHAADRVGHYSDLSGPLGTRADLGQWREYITSADDGARQLYDELATGTNLSGLGLNATETADLRAALVKALKDRNANPEDAFKALAGSSPWAAGNTWFDLWDKVKSHAIVTAVQQGHRSQSAWNNLPNAVSGRYYHEAYEHQWSSYLSTARGAGKLSRYQFRDHGEFFGEVYATYYMTPGDPGSIVRAWNPAVYEWFRANVDQGFTTRARP